MARRVSNGKGPCGSPREAKPSPPSSDARWMSRLCFATGCRFCSLCSQQGLLWRNLITLFFTVNNPGEKFSHRRPPQADAAPLHEHRQRRAMLPCAQRPDTPRVPHAKRKPLKRSTFVFSARAHRAHPGTSARAPDGTPDATHTAPKQRRKLFTSLIAFCHRIYANAQTFLRSSPPGSHRFDVPSPPRATRMRTARARRGHPGAHGDTQTCAHDRTVMHTPPMRISGRRRRERRPHRRRFSSRTDNDGADGHGAGKKKRPHQATVLSDPATISDRRLPAARHTRPGPADRSTRRWPRTRPRRSSLRRRHLR